MTTTAFNFRLTSSKSIEFTVSNCGDFLSTSNDNVGIVISGYIKDEKFYLQTSSKEVIFFEEELIKATLRAYNKATNRKIK